MYESYSIWPKGKRKHFDSHQNGYVYEYSWTSRATRRICARTGPLFSLINIHWRSCRLRHVHIWLWQCNVPPICFIGIAYFEEIVNDDGFQLTGPDCAPTPRCIDRKAHSATNLFPELNKQTIKKEKNRYLITIYSIDQTLFNRTKPANSFLRLELLHRIHQWLGNRLINTIIWIQNEFDSLFFYIEFRRFPANFITVFKNWRSIPQNIRLETKSGRILPLT